MLSLQPISLIKYLNFFKQSSWHFNQPTKTLFYLSWEDALWDLLHHKNICSGSVILVPDFFCDDVENNMTAHGLKVISYPVNHNLQTSESQLIKTIKKHHPTIIVIFHPVGITNQLLIDREWMEKISSDTILIEDCVHRIIDPSQVRFFKQNHFMITSLRKVVPLQGSIVFGRNEDLPFKESSSIFSWWYAIKVTFLWLLMNVFANLAQIFNLFSQLSKKCAWLAEKIMLIGYDLIGDNKEPAKGWSLFFMLYKMIDFSSVKNQKERQAMEYEKLFPSTPLVYEPEDRKELRGWPLIIPLKKAKDFLDNVRKDGLLLRFELNNSSWSQRQKIVYLPMGPHISEQQQRIIADIVQKYY